MARLIIAILQKGIAFITVPLIAAIFGTRGDYESYLVASSIPTLVVSFVSLGAINIVFIPIFSDYKTNYGEREAWNFANVIISLYMLIVLLVTVCGVLTSPLLFRVSAPGLPSEMHELGTALTRVLFASTIATGLSSAFVGLLNSYNIFVGPAICQLVGTATGVVSIVLLQDTWGVWSLVFANVLAAASPVLLMAAIYQRIYVRNVRLVWNLRHPGLKKVLTLFVAISVSTVAVQVNSLSDRFFASFVGPGAIATLDYAHKLIAMIIGLFIGSLTVPVFADLASHAARKDLERVRQSFSFGVRMLLLFLVPVTIFAGLFRVPIIRLLYERGEFSAATTLQVSDLFVILAVTIVLQGLSNMLGYTYYALQKPKPVVVIIVASVVLTIVLDILLIGPLGLRGLAWALTLAYIAGTACNYLYMRHLLRGLEDDRVLKCLAKAVASSTLAGLVGYGLYTLPIFSDWGGLGAQTVRLSVPLAASFALYLVLLTVFRLEEASVVWERLARRVVVARERFLQGVARRQ